MCSFSRLFKNVLEQFKHRSAVAYWDETNTYRTLSYEEVDDISKNIIEVIGSIIKDKFVCIGLLMEHNPFIPSIIISLQICNLAFIFLDPYSLESNLNSIRELNIKWILSNDHGSYNNLVSKYALLKANANFEKADSLKLWETALAVQTENSFEDICFVVCTSGTTGKPKIVQVEQKCIMSNVITLRKIFELTAEDVIYFGTPLTFDPSMVELFLTLISGSTLLVVPSRWKINPASLLTALFPGTGAVYKGVTVLQMVPSLFLRWNRSDIEFILQHTTCRVLAFGGERFPESILKIKKSVNLRILNLYGVTEVSCWASVYEIKSNDEEIPLGEPLDDTILEVRDECGSKMFDGQGELYIGSFSRICYVNEENKLSMVKPVFRSTGDRVRINNNAIYYVCRTNNLIKRLGCRVDLSEIEKTVFECTNIPSVCIWLDNKCKLILFVAISEFNLITKEKILDKLRVKLLHILPKQWFPNSIEIIKNFPLTKHGKIDRKSLEEIYNNLVDNFSLSKQNAADLFTYLCSKYLGLSVKGIEKYYRHNFFEIGGNSVLAIQYLSEFRDIVRIDYPKHLTTLLFEKTLGECYSFIKGFQVKPLRKRIHDPNKFCDNKVRLLGDLHIQSAETSRTKLQICWCYNLGACVDSSPVVVDSRNSSLVAVGSFSHKFVILESKNGNVISEVLLPDTIESSCCASLFENHVYVGCYDGKMYCINFVTDEIVWDYSTGDRIKCTPCFCLQQRAIVFGSYDKHVHCIDVQRGILIWKTLVSESLTSSPVYDQQKIYIATTFGTCLCLVENNGKILWKFNIGAPIFGSPCLDDLNGNIVWPDVEGTLHSFSCKSGEKQWTHKINGNIYSALTRLDSFVIFGSHNHNIYCLQINDNNCILNYMTPLESAVHSTSRILRYKGNVYIITATIQGIICVIEFNSGKIIERLPLPGEIFSSPVVKDNRIYIGCRDNNLYCLSIDVNNEVNK